VEVFRQSLGSGTCVMVTVTGVDVRNAQKDEASSAAAAKPAAEKTLVLRVGIEFVGGIRKCHFTFLPRGQRCTLRSRERGKLAV